MLKDKNSSAIVAVSDLARARRFYGDTLGLAPTGNGMEGVLEYRTGATSLVVYRSEGLRPGTGNAVAWTGGGDVAAIAGDLRAKGVGYVLLNGGGSGGGERARASLRRFAREVMPALSDKPALRVAG